MLISGSTQKYRIKPKLKQGRPICSRRSFPLPERLAAAPEPSPATVRKPGLPNGQSCRLPGPRLRKTNCKPQTEPGSSRSISTRVVGSAIFPGTGPRSAPRLSQRSHQKHLRQIDQDESPDWRGFLQFRSRYRSESMSSDRKSVLPELPGSTGTTCSAQCE